MAVSSNRNSQIGCFIIRTVQSISLLWCFYALRPLKIQMFTPQTGGVSSLCVSLCFPMFSICFPLLLFPWFLGHPGDWLGIRGETPLNKPGWCWQSPLEQTTWHLRFAGVIHVMFTGLPGQTRLWNRGWLWWLSNKEPTTTRVTNRVNQPWFCWLNASDDFWLVGAGLCTFGQGIMRLNSEPTTTKSNGWFWSLITALVCIDMYRPLVSIGCYPPVLLFVGSGLRGATGRRERRVFHVTQRPQNRPPPCHWESPRAQDWSHGMWAAFGWVGSTEGLWRVLQLLMLSNIFEEVHELMLLWWVGHWEISHTCTWYRNETRQRLQHKLVDREWSSQVT